MSGFWNQGFAGKSGRNGTWAKFLAAGQFFVDCGLATAGWRLLAGI
jgi:hypothetical protein